MVGHLLQYHPVFARLRVLVKQGALGHLKYIYSNRLSLGKIRAEEDVVWSFAPHDISMILSLAGQDVKTVRCEASDILQSGISDTANLHLCFENGLRGHVSCSWLHPYKEQKLVVIGDKGMAVFDDTLDWNEKLAIYDHKIDMEVSPPSPLKAEVRYEKVPKGEPLRSECKYFLDLMSGLVSPLTDGAEGRRVFTRSWRRQVRRSIAGRQSMPDYSDLFENVFVHESSYIDDGVEIGAGTKIWHFSHILGNTQLGKNCSLGQNVVVGPNVVDR